MCLASGALNAHVAAHPIEIPYISRKMSHAVYGEPFTQVAVCPTSVLYNIIDDGCIPFKTYSVTGMSQYFSGALLLIATHHGA